MFREFLAMTLTPPPMREEAARSAVARLLDPRAQNLSVRTSQRCSMRSTSGVLEKVPAKRRQMFVSVRDHAPEIIRSMFVV
jgi:hypothetical protein